jgi:hypothetical protein
MSLIVAIIIGSHVCCFLAAALDQEQFIDLLEHSSNPHMSTWDIQLDVRDTHIRKSFTTDEIVQLFADEEKRIRERNPVITEIAIDEMYADFEFSKYKTSGKKLVERTQRLLIDPGRGMRIEEVYNTFVHEGEHDREMEGRKQIYVFNSDYSKQYMPQREAGFLEPGIVANKRAFLDAMGPPYLHRLGMPPFGGAVRGETLARLETETQGGDSVIKAVFSDGTEEGLGNTYVLHLLPDKGYRLKYFAKYLHGVLLESTEYTSYREVEPGMWYPFSHSSIFPRNATIPEEIKRAIRNGDLELSDDAVLGATSYDEYLIRERTVEQAIFDADIPDAQFTLDFPKGTMVHDYVMATEKGKPLKYRTGWPDKVQAEVVSLNDLLPHSHDFASEASLTASPTNAVGQTTKHRHGRIWVIALAVLGATMLILSLVRQKHARN